MILAPLYPPNLNNPIHPDKVPVDFTKRSEVKDLNNPSTGRTHAPGRKVLPLERSLPPLLPWYEKVCQEQIVGLRKKKVGSKKKKKGANPNPPTAPAIPPNAREGITSGQGGDDVPHKSTTPSTDTPWASSSSKKARKARKKKKQNEKAKKRRELQEMLHQYLPIEAPNGLVIEDEYGIPLIVLIRLIFPAPFFQSMNVRYFPNHSLSISWFF